MAKGKYRLYAPGGAEMRTTVTVNDRDEEGNLLPEEDILDEILNGDINIPTLCHQCSGGDFGRPSLEIGDEWDWSKAEIKRIGDADEEDE